MGSWNKHHQLAVDLVSGTYSFNEIELGALLGVCPVCRGGGHDSILLLSRVPALSCKLWDDRVTARSAPAGSIELVSCSNCGNIYNKAFDPGLITYDHSYENSLEYSKTHRDYVAELAERLVERVGLTNGTVIDIGVGRGLLLRSMAVRFGVRGIGIDPGVTDRFESFASGGSVRFVNGFFATFPESTSSDLVVCQHILEHLPAPWALLRQIRDRHLPQGVRVYIEVPNGQLLYGPSGIWDLIYEHVSHFTERSLVHLAQSEGFRILDRGTSFGGQYLWLIAESSKRPAPPSHVHAGAEKCSVNHARTIENWREAVRRWTSNGRRLAIWGAGAKGSTFANLLDPAGEIFSVFDINPKKRNRYIPRSGHRIQAPQDLPSCRPDIVIAMNPLYTREIAQAIDEMGSPARVIGITEFDSATGQARRG